MNLNDLLIYIDDYARKKGIVPYIVGGAVRDHFLIPNSLPEDVDCTTGDKKIHGFSYELSKKFPGADFKIFDDNHTALQFDNFRIDFSNNFISPQIKEAMPDASSLKLEMFSRDFTINAMLMNLKRDTIYDVTENGVEDIKNKILRCPVNPKITLLNDPKRILRAIKYSLKLGFTIEEDVTKVIKDNAKLVKELPMNYIKNIISEILEIDPQRGIEEMYKLGVLRYVPLTKKLTQVLTQNRDLAKYFGG